MKEPHRCHNCRQYYDLAKISLCPYCGIPYQKDAGLRHWGGRRPGAGAPFSNVNALKHGRRSRVIQNAVEKLLEDPEMAAYLHLVIRAAQEGKLQLSERGVTWDGAGE